MKTYELLKIQKSELSAQKLKDIWISMDSASGKYENLLWVVSATNSCKRTTQSSIQLPTINSYANGDEQFKYLSFLSGSQNLCFCFNLNLFKTMKRVKKEGRWDVLRIISYTSLAH